MKQLTHCPHCHKALPTTPGDILETAQYRWIAVAAEIAFNQKRPVVIYGRDATYEALDVSGDDA